MPMASATAAAPIHQPTAGWWAKNALQTRMKCGRWNSGSTGAETAMVGKARRRETVASTPEPRSPLSEPRRLAGHFRLRLQNGSLLNQCCTLLARRKTSLTEDFAVFVESEIR